MAIYNYIDMALPLLKIPSCLRGAPSFPAFPCSPIGPVW